MLNVAAVAASFLIGEKGTRRAMVPTWPKPVTLASRDGQYTARENGAVTLVPVGGKPLME
jgi:hypothetical protein